MCSFTTAWRGVVQFGLQGGQICSLLLTEESAWPPHSHDHSSILPECLGFKSYCILLQCFQLCVLQILQCCFLGLGQKHVCWPGAAPRQRLQCPRTNGPHSHAEETGTLEERHFCLRAVPSLAAPQRAARRSRPPASSNVRCRVG